MRHTKECCKCGREVLFFLNTNINNALYCAGCLAVFNSEHDNFFGLMDDFINPTDYSRLNANNIRVKLRIDISERESSRTTPQKLFGMGIKVCVCGKLMALETTDCPRCGEDVFAMVG